MGDPREPPVARRAAPSERTWGEVRVRIMVRVRVRIMVRVRVRIMVMAGLAAPSEPTWGEEDIVGGTQ